MFRLVEKYFRDHELRVVTLSRQKKQHSVLVVERVAVRDEKKTVQARNLSVVGRKIYI